MGEAIETTKEIVHIVREAAISGAPMQESPAVPQHGDSQQSEKENQLNLAGHPIEMQAKDSSQQIQQVVGDLEVPEGSKQLNAAVVKEESVQNQHVQEQVEPQNRSLSRPELVIDKTMAEQFPLLHQLEQQEQSQPQIRRIACKSKSDVYASLTSQHQFQLGEIPQRNLRRSNRLKDRLGR